MLDGELEWLTDGLEPRDGKTIHDQIEESGAPALLLSRYEGRLRVYEPWRHGREVSLLFLGDDISAEEADELLVEEGFGFLRLVDNGLMHGVMGDGRAYHLIPRAASKARAVARHMQARGYAPEECIAVGDSREDLGAAAVGRHVLARGERDGGGARRGPRDRRTSASPRAPTAPASTRP